MDSIEVFETFGQGSNPCETAINFKKTNNYFNLFLIYNILL